MPATETSFFSNCCWLTTLCVHAVLCCSFNITDRFVHDISVTGTEHGTVIMNGAGFDINLDHHRMAPYQVGRAPNCSCCCCWCMAVLEPDLLWLSAGPGAACKTS